MKGNREYKSDVFSMLMEEPQNALALYNALNGSAYDDASMVELCTLDRGISLTVRNDAAFVLDMSLSIYEHQSTVCPNMPIRSLIYFTATMEDFLRGADRFAATFNGGDEMPGSRSGRDGTLWRNVYGRTLVRIPTPRFAVFYNGDEEQPEQYTLRLSDAYARPVEQPELELICRVYNINYGKNRSLLENCTFLRDYMTFVDYVRMYHRENDYYDLEHCIELAIDRCIEENVLRDFLIRRRTEVVKVMKLDYTFDRQLMMERENNWEEGRQEGLLRGRKEGLEKLVMQICKKYRKNKSIEEIADDLEEEVSAIEPICRIAEEFAPDYDWQKVKEKVLASIPL